MYQREKSITAEKFEEREQVQLEPLLGHSVQNDRKRKVSPLT